jgi:outer membrane protein
MVAQVKAAETDVSSSFSAWYPAVYLFADLVYAQPNQRYFPAEATFNLSWDVGVSASIDVSAWYSALFKTEEANARLAALRDNVAQLNDTIALDVTRACLALSQAGEALDAAKAAFVQADDYFNSVSEDFKNGIALHSDLLEARLQRNQAGFDVTQAKIDYQIAVIDLDRASGRDPLAKPEAE